MVWALFRGLTEIYSRASIAATIAWAGSLIGAVEYVASNEWSGAADLSGMTVWSLPLAAVIFVATHVLFGTRRRANSVPSWICWAAILVGPALGVGCFAIAAAFLDGWRVGFPVFVCWAFGATLGLIAAATISRRQFWPAAVAVSVGALVLLVFINALLQRSG